MPRLLIAPFLVLFGCIPTAWTPPTLSPPAPGYVAASAEAEVLWDATLDFLSDTSTGWEPWLAGEYFAQGTAIVLAEGPLRRKIDSGWGNSVWSYVANPEAAEYADCGERDGEPTAGWGDLKADMTFRVRTASDGTGLLKVVLTNVRAEDLPAGTPRGSESRIIDRCTSTGKFEREVVDLILARIDPIIR